MKILVDEMPKEICECPYFTDIEDGCYGCTYKSHHGECYTPCGKDPSQCPYFTEIPMDKIIEKIKDEVYTPSELRDAIKEVFYDIEQDREDSQYYY